MANDQCLPALNGHVPDSHDCVATSRIKCIPNSLQSGGFVISTFCFNGAVPDRVGAPPCLRQACSNNTIYDLFNLIK